MKSKVDIIVLWAHPRSLSTVFERVMMERGDFDIIHEPFAYIYYVLEKKAPATGMIIDPSHPTQFKDIKNSILETSQEKSVFLKDMAYHCYDYLVEDKDFLLNVVNTFIIRDPAKSIPSYYCLDSNIIEDEIGYKQQYYLFKEVIELTGQVPILIDADDLQSHPKEILTAYCNSLNIEFIPEALDWKQPYNKQWNIWKIWHKDAATSNTILPNQINKYQENITNNYRIRELYEYSLPFYQKMYSHRLMLN